MARLVELIEDTEKDGDFMNSKSPLISNQEALKKGRRRCQSPRQVVRRSRESTECSPSDHGIAQTAPSRIRPSIKNAISKEVCKQTEIVQPHRIIEPSIKLKVRALGRRAENPLLKPLAQHSRCASASDGIRQGGKANGYHEIGYEDTPRPAYIGRRRVDGIISSAVRFPKTTASSQSAKTSNHFPNQRIWKNGLLDSSFDATDEEESSSDGLSDFVVSDDSCGDDGGSMSLAKPTRRLVRGVPNRAKTSACNEVDQMEDLNLGAPHQRQLPNPESTQKSDSSDSEKPSTSTYHPLEPRLDGSFRQPSLGTPDDSPKILPQNLQSPVKKFSRIPATPHRPSMDSFWSQDVINEWNDEFSPSKQLISRQLDRSNVKPLVFPISSPEKKDVANRKTKKAFSEKKHAIAETFLAEIDQALTDGRISSLAASTGGIKIIWSKKLNTTAGRASWKLETVRNLRAVEGGVLPLTHRHHATIELADKVIDDEDRLLNVIAHEFCHLATFMISNVKTNPHGREFKQWASKCSRHFGHRGIEVTTKHSYAIDYKYVWSCDDCALEYKRHSKSIDPARQRCGKCKGHLVQMKPIRRNGEVKITGYQLFVKTNMSKVRAENPGSPQKDIMGLLGKRYQESRAISDNKESKSDTKEALNMKFIEGKEEDEKEQSEDEGLIMVGKRLGFLDLRSL